MDEPLRRTEAGSELPEAATPVASLFYAKERLVRMAVGLAVLEAVACVFLITLLFFESRKDRLFLVLDGTGNVVTVPGRTFSQARELQTEQALLAATALLTRGPTSFDLPEVLQGMFSSVGLSQANSLRQQETKEFLEKQLQQKPQVTQIDALETRENAILIRISGQLFRVGFFKQQPFTEVIPFRLDLTLKHNTDLLRNRRQPTIVTDFKLRYDTPNT